MNQFAQEDHEARIKYCSLALYNALEAIESHATLVAMGVRGQADIDVEAELLLMAQLASVALNSTERNTDGR